MHEVDLTAQNTMQCRSIAAVLLGNPDDFTAVAVTGSTRFQELNDRNIDVLIWGDTHTLEREVREVRYYA